MRHDECEGRTIEKVIEIRTQRLISFTKASDRSADPEKWRRKALAERDDLKRLFVLLAFKEGRDPADAPFEAGRHFGLALAEAAHRALRARTSSRRVLRLVPANCRPSEET